MSYSYLSGLERDKHSISITNLQRLAAFFHVDMVYFLDSSDRKDYLIRKEDRVTLNAEEDAVYQVISPDTSENLQVSFAEIPAHQPTERHIHKHPKGEEFITVTAGEAVVLVEDHKYVLKTGDSVIFPSEKEHCIYTEDCAASILIVTSPPYGRGSRTGI